MRIKNLFCVVLITVFLILPWSSLGATPISGQVFGWGYNGNGEATGTPTPDSHPALRPGIMSCKEYYELSHPCTNGFVTIAGQVLTDAVAVAAGNCHGLALRTDGTVVGWGLNRYGEATGTPSQGFASGQVKIDGQILSNVVAISACFYDSLALRGDGTIIRWGGLPNTPQAFYQQIWSNVIAVSAGYDFGLVLKRDGTVGSLNSYMSKLPRGVLTNIVAVAAPGDMAGVSLGLTKDGNVVQWGAFCRQPAPEGAAKAVAIAVGGESCYVLKKDGTVFGWGENRFGKPKALSPRDTDKMSDGLSYEGAKAMTHAIAIVAALSPKDSDKMSDGLVCVEGKALTNVIAIAAAGARRSPGHGLALKRDGTVMAWGDFSDNCPAFVPCGLSNVIAIAAGGGPSIDGNSAGYCLAITSNKP